MTKVARDVLADCREAHNELVNGLSGSLWRRRYFACVALLRTVGHVLHKVDSEVYSKHGSAIKDWWQNKKDTKPEPAIYWSFVEEERNLFLKTYGPVAAQNMTVYPGGDRESEISYVMKDGPFKGVDPRNLILDAIEWWEQELDTIDRNVASTG